MNYSRHSYSGPPESECGGVLLDLRHCEFCERTFLPVPLLKHKKICYREFLKKKSNASKCKSTANGKSTGPKDLLGRSMSDIMVVRRIRRMQWRDRHEHFIQIIRSARDNSFICNNGGIISASPNNMDNKEDLRQCKHCLRNFHKDSIQKHSNMCKEHSIQSNRFIPNDSHIEAKRRMSLRLYYQPKSFRQDCGDDSTAATSPGATECSSIASSNSIKFHSDMSELSSMRSSPGSKSRTLSASSPKLTNPIIQESSKIYKNKEIKKSKTKPNERNYQKSLENERKDLNQSTKNKNEYNVNKNISETSNNNKCSQANKDMDCRQKNIAQKLKIISKMLEKNDSKDVDIKSFEHQNYVSGPYSANSFNKAKEILQYLEIKMEEKEAYRKSFVNESSSNEVNVEEELECNKQSNNIEVIDLFNLLEKIRKKLQKRKNSNLELNRINDSIGVGNVTTLSYEPSPNCADHNTERNQDLEDLLSKIQSFSQHDLTYIGT